ncbi:MULTISPECIES: anti-phage protein KwaB [Morganellaceae]|nr:MULTISPECIES: anti-phage protein KwaB [Providencia]
MTIQQLKEKTAKIIDNFSGIRVVFTTTTNELKLSRIEGSALDSIAAGFLDKIKEDIVDNEDLTSPLLSNFDDRKNALFKFDYEQFPEEFEKIIQAIAIPPNSQDYYNPLNKFTDVKGIIILISGDNKCLALYKNKTNLTVLKNSRKLFNLVPDPDGYLKQLPNEILRLDFNYDLFSIDEVFYIKNHKTLETQMKFHKVIEAQAVIALDSLRNSLLIEDMSGLEKSAKEISFARKLAKISKHSPVLGKIDAQTIINYVSQHKYLSSLLQINKAGDKLLIKTKVSQKHFIKLMSDDYLQSELTKIIYMSIAKDRLDE